MEQTKSSRRQEFNFLMVIGTAWLFDAMDVGLLSFIMPAMKADWGLTASQTGLIGAISSLGMVIGAMLFGYLADVWGPNHVLILTLMIFSISNILLAVAPNLTITLIIRFLAGMGLGGELPVASAAIADNFSGTQRSKALVYVDSFWAFGWILASCLAYLLMPMYGWRVTVLVTAVTAFYAIIMRKFFKGDHQVIDHQHKLSWFDRLKMIWDRDHRKKTAVLWIVWFVVMFSYYGMFLWLPIVLVLRGFSIIHSFGYVLLMSLAQLPGYYLAAWLIGKINRKKVLIAYLIGTIFSAFLFSIATSEILVLVSGSLLSFFNLGLWGIMIAFTPDQYEPAWRGTGTGSASGIGRIGAIVGPLLVGILLDVQVSMVGVFLVFIAALVIGLITIVSVREIQ